MGIMSPSQNSPGIEFIARGCLIHGSRVLLCRNVKHGYAYLPGGHVEFQESAASALAREFLEECGLPIRVGGLALVSEGVFPARKRMHHEVNLVFHVEQTSARSENRDGPLPVESREPGISFEWIELAAIPETDVRPIAAKAWLATLGREPGPQIEWASEITA
jgi:ADP-ribose pyrophosphatase YjhB (NUDIX family)